MCGFVGIFARGKSRAEPNWLEDVMAASTLIKHRGPDESGQVQGETYVMAHRRLSIIDLQGSHQPMGCAGDVLAFNGEILNYRHLRLSQGIDVSGAGDTEVLLSLLRAHGTDALRSVRGQYAFAWVHENGDVLTLARDPRGILPAYYALDGDRIIFASEIKAILPLLSARPEVDRLSVAEYLVTRATYAPYTMYEGIFKLRPGEILTFDRRGRTSRHSTFEKSIPSRDFVMTMDDGVVRLDSLLADSVDQALTADVPVGCYLSGGIDSSLITALARQRVPDVHTFAAGFAETGFAGELPAARFVSHKLKTTHHEVVIDAAAFLNSLSDLTWHRDAPLSEPADVAVAALAREASNHVRVVLSGEGADELFLGYPKHRAEALLGPALAVPGVQALTRAASAALDRVPNRARRLRIALRAASSPTALERWLAWFGSFSVHEAAGIVGVSAEDILDRMRSRRDYQPSGASTSLDAMATWDLATWLADNLLERGERMTMAASVELRPPYLDAPIVEFAQHIPAKFLLGGGGKQLLRRVAQRYLPEDVWARPKAGFPMPLSRWFDRPEILERATDLGSSALGRSLDETALEAIALRHRTGQRDESSRLWALASLLAWDRQAFGGEPATAEPGTGGCGSHV